MIDVHRAETVQRRATIPVDPSEPCSPTAARDDAGPFRGGLGALTLFSDSTLAGGSGTALHGHQDLEVITYVVAGTYQHRDSVNNRFTLSAGAVECMSFGTGAQHAQHNASATDPLRLVLLYVTPRAAGGPVALGAATPARAERRDALFALVLPDAIGADAGARSGRYGGTPRVRQDATLYAAALSPGVYVTHPLDEGHGAYVYVLSGGLAVRSGQEVPALLAAGDIAAVTDVGAVRLSGIGAAEVLVVDVPLLITDPRAAEPHRSPSGHGRRW